MIEYAKDKHLPDFGHLGPTSETAKSTTPWICSPKTHFSGPKCSATLLSIAVLPICKTHLITGDLPSVD